MTQLPTVSILINNYNYGRFLGEAIDSALGQTYPDVEVIVVDDGSTDNSREVIASRGDTIRAILKTNGGQASALNAGFEISKGELILFLDSDDILEANAIETVVREWRDGAARVFFPLLAVDESGATLGWTVGGTTSPRAMIGPYCGGAESTSGTVFARDVLEKVMPIPEEEWRICADNYLCAASSLFGEAVCLGQPLGRYRMHGKNNYQGAQPSLARTRKSVTANLKLYEGLARFADSRMGTLEQWLGTCPEHWIRRITSLREGPHDHPWPDTLPGLTARAVKAAWRRPGWNFRRRISFSLYAVPYGLLPQWAIDGVRGVLRKVDGRDHGRTTRRLLGA